MTAARNSYALLIGSNQFANPTDFGELKTTEQNVKALECLLTGENGGNLPPENIKKILNPTSEKMLKELTSFLEEVRVIDFNEHEYILIYFTGHGAIDIKSGEFLFVTKNTEKSKNGVLPFTGVSARNFFYVLEPFLTENKNRNLVIVLDCCNSAVFNYFITKSIELSVTCNLYLLASSIEISYDQDQFDPNPQLYSVFTRHFLSALENGIPVGKLESYLRTQINFHHIKLLNSLNREVSRFLPEAFIPGGFKDKADHFYLTRPIEEFVEVVDYPSDLQLVRREYLDWVTGIHNEIKVYIPAKRTTIYIPNDELCVNIYEDISTDESLNESKLKAQTEFGSRQSEGSSDDQDIFKFKGAWGNRVFLSGQNRSLKELVQKGRAVVLLGDPGSGKTTVARYLASQLAMPKAEQSIIMQDDFWDGYFPIIVCMADYSEAFIENKKQLSLEKYLGRLTWKKRKITDRSGKEIPSTLLSLLLKQELDNQKVVIILDGLDEVRQFRDAIMTEVERFIDERLPGTLDPDLKRRNVLLATSRLIGYETRPLQTKNVVRAKVAEMARRGIVLFIEQIVKFYRNIPGKLTDAERKWLNNEDKAEIPLTINPLFDEVSDLIEKIFSDESVIQELACNPMLLTVICGIYFGDSELPRVKAELYHKFVMGFADLSSTKSISALQLKKLMSELAHHIHKDESNEIFSERKLRNILIKIKQGNESREAAEHLLQVFKEDSGLVVKRADELYSFSHRTLQEYLAACYLIEQTGEIGNELKDYLYSPYWREVIVFAISELSRLNSPIDFKDIIFKLLNDEYNEAIIIPHLASVIAQNIIFIDDECLTAELITGLTENMILTYSRNYLSPFNTSLRSYIVSALLRLAEKFKSIVLGTLNKEVEKKAYKTSIFWACVELIKETGLYDQKTLRTLSQSEFYDNEEQDFIIGKFLDSVVGEGYQIQTSLLSEPPIWDEKNERKNNPTEYRNRKRMYHLQRQHYEMEMRRSKIINSVKMPANISPMRSLLIGNSELTETLINHAPLLRLTNVLYGGYGNLGVLEWDILYKKLASFLQLPDNTRELIKSKDESFFASNFGYGDTIYTCAVYLDTYKPKILKSSKDELLPTLHPTFIFRNSSLHHFIARQFLGAADSRELIKMLLQFFQSKTIAREKIEILLGLLALGHNIKNDLEELRQNNLDSYNLAIIKIKSIPVFFADALIRSKDKLMTEVTDRVESDNFIGGLLAVNYLVETLIKAGGTSVKINEKGQQLMNAVSKADNWFKTITDLSDGIVYNFAVVLDTLPTGIDLKETLLSVYWSPHVRSARYFTSFRWDIFPVSPSARAEQWPFEVYEILESFSGFDNLPSNKLELQAGFFVQVLTNSSELLDYPHRLEAELFMERIIHFDRDSYVLAVEGRYAVILDFPEVVDKITDPYMKARCTYQYALGLPPLERYWCVEIIRGLLPDLTINQRVRLLIRVLNLIVTDNELSTILLTQLRELIPRITDPAERAVLAVNALNPHVDHQHLLELLHHAVDALFETDSSSIDFITVIDALTSYKTRFPEISIKLGDVISSCGDSWVQSCLQNQAANYLITAFDERQDNNPVDNQSSAPYLLIAAVYDLLQKVNETDSLEDLWIRLAAEPSKNERAIILSRILEQGEQSGIRINRSISQCVSEWIKTADEAEKALLLPLLIEPSFGAMPTVELWYLNYKGIEKKVGLLCIVEKNNIISAGNVDDLLALLYDENDRIQLRANLVWWTGIDKVTFKGGRKFKTSVLGQEVLTKITSEYLTTELPIVKRALRLFFAHVLHDDTILLKLLLEKANKPVADPVASCLLRNIYEVTEDCWLELKQSYPVVRSQVQEMLIESFSWLSWSANTQKYQPSDITTVIKQGKGSALKKKFFCNRFALAYLIKDLSLKVSDWTRIEWTKEFAPQMLIVGELLDNSSLATIAESSCHYEWSYIDKDKSSTMNLLCSTAFYEGLITAVAWHLEHDESAEVSVALLDLLAFFTPDNADRFERFVYENQEFPERLFNFISGVSNPDRVACRAVLLLLRYLPYFNEETVVLIKYSLNFIDDTLAGILEDTIQQLDSQALDFRIFDELLKELDSGRSKRVILAANLLSLLVRKNEFKGEQMTQLIRKLNNLIGDPYSKRGIYKLAGNGNDVDPKTITFTNQLNVLLYEVLLKVCGD